MGGSLPLILFFGFLVLLVALGTFLDALVKRAARAEQEARARAREAREKRPLVQPPPARAAAPATPARAGEGDPLGPPVSAPPPPPAAPRPVEAHPAEELLRRLLGLPPAQPEPRPPRPQPPRPRPAPRQQPVPVARPVPPPARPASLSERHLTPTLAERHLQPKLTDPPAARPTRGEPGAPAEASPLAFLDRLPPLARAVVVADLLGPPASRRRPLHRVRPV